MLYKEDLEHTACQGCSTSGCKHEDHSQFFLHARCHMTARCDVCYKVGTGFLEISCGECKKLICKIAVQAKAEKVEDPPNIEAISALRVDLYDCEKHPSEILRPEWPREFKRRAWIPQTMGDQIWVLFEFNSVEDRLKWEAGLSELLKKWLSRDLIEHALPFGWAVRDYNGFEEATGS